ncbi:MAG: glycosyltransferase family 4 protein [Candidatus Hydrogenedentes bacterium]|nr:glycosyltransferase family 4 protein [Candidatus Hydrogenedentota bacterium]
MSLRVAMVGACPYPVPQGSQIFLRDTALAMHHAGHDVHLVVYGYGLGADQSGLKLHRCRRLPGDTKTSAGPSFSKPFLDLALVSTLRRVVRKEGIEVVHAHNYEALIVALLARKGPVVYHAHNAMSDELPYYFRHKYLPYKVGRWLDKHLPRRADRIVVPHRRLAGHLVIRGCDHTKISIVPPPVKAEQFQVAEVARALPPVLYAGNLDSYQNLGLLFSAMDRVKKRVSDARLIVATADEAELPNAELVHTAGFDTMHKLLAQDSVFAVPRVSWSGYPIKLLNAMASGKAIVACESAAYPLTDRVNGLIVPDNDEGAFADALHELMVSPRLRMELGRSARETIVTEHKPERVAQMLEEIDNDLLRRKPEVAAPEVSQTS